MTEKFNLFERFLVLQEILGLNLEISLILRGNKLSIGSVRKIYDGESYEPEDDLEELAGDVKLAPKEKLKPEPKNYFG